MGPKSARTYWIRRLIVLLALLLAIGLIVFGLRALFGGKDSPKAPATPTVTPSSTPSGVTTPSATAQGSATATVAACNPADVTVTATTDRSSYPVTGIAQVGMTIQSRAASECTFDVGSAALELVVFSGQTRVWSSDDCQGSSQSRPTVLKPGATGQLSSRVRWDLTRSAPGCATASATTHPKVTPGTYRLEARAGGLRSAGKDFQVAAS